MWNIWRFVITSIRWIHWSYYFCSYCRVGRQNKEFSLFKLHWHGDLSFIIIFHWSYLLMFFQQGRLCESWREDTPNKAQRHSKSPRYFWIWDCKIYSVRSESGRMILIQDHAYYVLGFPKDLRILYPHVIHTLEGYKGTFIAYLSWWAWSLCGA